MGKVRCRFCKFEDQSKCSIKKGTKVKVNKKRSCSDYQGDEDKIVEFLERRKNNSKPEAIIRPDWLWDKKARRAERDKAVTEEMNRYQTTASPSKKHPLTGDLSRFTADVPKETVAGE